MSPKGKLIMKILQLTASSVLALLILSGCSAGHDYWGNRLDDAKDIFTFTAGGGFGVKVQVGPVQADMYNYASLYGLRSGEILDGAHPHSEEYHVSEGNIGVPLPFANTEIFYPGKHAAERGKAYCAMTPLLPFFILLPDEHSRNFCNSCAWKEKFRNREAQKTSEDASPELEKDENPRQLPFDGRRAWYKYSSIEVTAALFAGFSIGVNPGELIDFLAGFACLDLYGDDL